MSINPDWMGVAKFSEVYCLQDLLNNRKLLPDFGGFYGWSLDRNVMKPGRVLYIGKTEGEGGFRARFSDYLRKNPRQRQKNAHSAALFLQDHYLRKTPPEQIFIHIAPFEGDSHLINLVEKAMMQYYRAWYNKSGMNSLTPFDTN